MNFAVIEQTTTSAFDRIVESGVLGAVTVLAILGMVLAVILLLKEKDKRVNDATKTRDNLAEPLKRIQESMERMEEKIIISKVRNREDGS